MITKEQAKRYCDEYAAGQSRMGPIKSLWKSLLFYCMPSAEHLVWDRNTEQNEYNVPSETTAIRAANTMASGIHSRSVSRGDRLGDVSVRDAMLNKDSDVQEWQSRQMTKLTELIQASNYAPKMFDMLRHFVILGTDMLYSYYDKDLQKINFKTYRPFDCWIEENAAGKVDRVIRCESIAHRIAEERWGSRLPDEIKKALEIPENTGDTSEYLHIVEPNPDYIPMKGATPANEKKAMLSKHFKYREVWVHKDSHTVLEEGKGYRTFPYHIARTGVQMGQLPFGRSVAMDALPTLRELHRADQWMSDASELELRPPTLLPKGSMDPADWDSRPDARMSYNPVEGNVPSQLSVVSSIDPMDRRMLRKEDQVEAFFFVPLFRALDQISGSNPTATEVNEAAKQGLQGIAPIIGNLEPDVHVTIIERGLDIMELEGLGTPKPDILKDKDLIVSVITQLDAELQNADIRRSLVALGQSFEIMKQFEENPEMNTLLDRDGMIRKVLYTNNVDPDLVYSERESLKKKQQLQEEQQARQLQQQVMDKIMPVDTMRRPEQGSMADPATGGLLGAG